MYKNSFGKANLLLLIVLALMLMSIFGTWFNLKQASDQVQQDPVWSDAKHGLKIGLVIKTRTNDELELALCFENGSNVPIRIYFLDSWFFRSFQSWFIATDRKGEVHWLTEISPGHGYIVGERDFPLLQPRSIVCFEQSVYLPGDSAEPINSLTWTYKNEIDHWEGGIETLDGLTEELFGEDDHPDLWLGELEVEAHINE